MKTFFLDLIPKIQRYSEKLDNITVLTNKHWVLLNEESQKTVYIFRELNNQLLISKNGIIEKANWEYLGNNSLLIDQTNGSYLFKHGFIDDSILALKIDGSDEYALLINEQKFEKYLNSINKVLSFLQKQYLNKSNDLAMPSLIRKSPIRENYTKKEHSKPIPKKVIWETNKNLKYTFESKYPENEFKIYNQNGNWGYIDKDENVAIDFIFEDAFPFSEGLAVVQLNEKKGFINRNGDTIIDFQFDSASFFKDGKSSVSINGDEFSIDKNGNKITTANNGYK